MEITYHKATAQDIEILADLRIEFITEFLGQQQPEDEVKILKENLKAYFKESLGNSSFICCIAKNGDDIVGIGGMAVRQQPGNFKNPSGRVGYFMNMFTIRAFRKKGICSAILDNLTIHAVAKGITAFELHATKDGEGLYMKNGFKIHSEPTYRKYLATE
jgi:hypothetical protein